MLVCGPRRCSKAASVFGLPEVLQPAADEHKEGAVQGPGPSPPFTDALLVAEVQAVFDQWQVAQKGVGTAAPGGLGPGGSSGAADAWVGLLVPRLQHLGQVRVSKALVGSGPGKQLGKLSKAAGVPGAGKLAEAAAEVMGAWKVQLLGGDGPRGPPSDGVGPSGGSSVQGAL